MLINVDYNSKIKQCGYCTIVFFNILILCGQTVSIVLNWDDIVLTTSSLAIYALKLQACYKLFFLYWEKNRIIGMHVCVRKYFWDTNVADETTKIELNRWFQLVELVLGSHFLMVMSVYIWFCFFPMTMYPPNVRSLPLQMWIPFDTNPSPLHELLYGFLCASGTGNIFIILLFDFLFVYFSQHLIVQFRLLQAVLPNMVEYSDFLLDDACVERSNEIQRIAYKRLNLYLRHHAMLLKFGRDLKLFSSLSITIQVITSMLTLTNLGFGISKEEYNFAGLQMLLLFFCMCVEIVLYGLHGSELEYQSVKVVEAAYQCRWYLTPPQFRQNFIFLQMNAQKEFKISASGFIIINNTTLLQIFKGIFSAITLLQTLDKN